MFVGTTTGEVVVVALATGAATTLRLHHHAITRLDVSPGDRRLMSEDAAGEQRLSALAP